MTKKNNAPRGIRLNNPGNVVRNHIRWQGLTDIQPDPRFCSFIKPVYGIRAMVRILMTYNGRGIDTVREIISAWAPKHENPLESYIAFVCRKTGAGPDEALDIDDPNDIIPLLQAIVEFENNRQPYDYQIFETAYYLATGKEKPCSTNLKQNSPPSQPKNSTRSSLTALFKSLRARLSGWPAKRW